MKKQLLFSVAAILTFTFHATADHLNDNLLVTAQLNGAQEVPSVTTNALGVASFMLNKTRDTICLNITVTGLSGPITGIHIHEGEQGVSGGIVKDLMPFLVGNSAAATLTGADVSMLNVSKLLSGKFYVNVHTSANPNGEIRGQLYLEADWSFPVMLAGDQQVPPVAGNAYGVGVFNLSRDFSRIKFNLVTQNLSGPVTSAHLHWGAVGTNGGIAVDLSTSLNGNGNVLTGAINSPSLMLIDSLMASRVYVNMHTAANPNGEIRSHLWNDRRYLYFDAALDGNQEVPSVMTTAKAVAAIKVNTRLDTLWYDVAATGLSGPISSAHFHNAPAGTNGAIEVDLTSTIIGNRITGKITGSTLTTALINKFLTGNMYVNIHTASNPGGEIRGQVYRLAREGYSFSLDGLQETPPVVTAARGSGIVSIDRDRDNVHFMIVEN